MNEPTPQISRMIVLPAQGSISMGGGADHLKNWDSNSDAKQLRDRDFLRPSSRHRSTCVVVQCGFTALIRQLGRGFGYLKP